MRNVFHRLVNKLEAMQVETLANVSATWVECRATNNNNSSRRRIDKKIAQLKKIDYVEMVIQGG